MPAACAWNASSTPFTSLIVTSPGGVGSSSVQSLAQIMDLPTNDVDNRDRLKHFLAGSGATLLPTRFGSRPLVLFLYDDPTHSLFSFARKGWLNFQAQTLNTSARARQTGVLSNEEHAVRLSCIHYFRHRHALVTKQDYRFASRYDARGCPRPHNESSTWHAPSTVREAKEYECASQAALHTLAPLIHTAHPRDVDILGFHRHFTGWVDAACNGRALFNESSLAAAAVLFARTSELWRHVPALAALLGVDAACIPSRFCRARVINHTSRSSELPATAQYHVAGGRTPLSPSTAATGSAGDAALAGKLKQHLERAFDPLKRLHALVGEFTLVWPPAARAAHDRKVPGACARAALRSGAHSS